MILIINPQTCRNCWACYTLTNAAGEVFDINLVQFTQLTALDGVELPDDDKIYMTLIDQDEDREKLWNRVNNLLTERGWQHLQWRMVGIAQNWRTGKRRGIPVICVETGERFVSATAAMKAHGLSYSQLNRHLNGEIGYRTVKGRTYKKC